MTRVIAGTHRGRRLAVPAGSGTRPTADRAREGMFSSLQSLVDLEGARFLDLYAGSGALGLEALSRGAAAATLVESDERALAVLRGNVEQLGLAAEVFGAPVEVFLAGEPSPYDVVVLDPPYELDLDPVLPALLPWLAEDAVVVVERRRRGAPPAWPEGLREERSRSYGEAVLWYGSRS
jgi:16S rRNA (guanine966-N2)-methyltransferase